MAETDPRARLAEAIARYGEAAGYVQRIASAKSRLLDREVAASRAMTAAEAVLAKVRRQAPDALVEALLSGDDEDGAAVKQAEAALAAAEAAAERHERAREALAREERAARADLQSAASARDEAVAAVLREAPAVINLLDALHHARALTKTIEAALEVMPAMTLPAYWHAVAAADEQPDPAVADRWRAAIAALALDPGAELPQPTRVIALTRRVVHPEPAPAAA